MPTFQTLNFDTFYTKPADGSWGSLTGNGSWTGLVGQLQRYFLTR